jgi:YD repeat-containing protein
MVRVARFASPLLVAWFALAAALWLPGFAAAADTEARDFAVSVDNKPAGEYHMTITRQDDGSVTMTAQADIHFTAYLIKKYSYTFRDTEVWKGGRCLRLDSTCNDDGTNYTVSAVADGATLRVRVNGQERITRGEVWLTTYWCLPIMDQRNRAVPLLDADTGRDITATLQYVGPAKVNVGGTAVDVAHWRLSGGVQVELYYDGQERLVRQEFVENGYRTVLELSRIRK